MKKVVLFLLKILGFNLSNLQTGPKNLKTKIKLKENEIDEFTGELKKITHFHTIAHTDTGFIKGLVRRVDDFYALALKSTSYLGCAGEKCNYVIFIFEDGSKLKLTEHLKLYNSLDSSISYYDITEYIDIFKNKKVTKIRFSQSKYYVDGNTKYCRHIKIYCLSQLVKATE